MPRTIRYHLDEHVDPAIAAGLRRRGIDVTTTSEQELRGTTDAEQLSFALSQSRVMVTFDADFLIAAAQGTKHAGIAYRYQGNSRIGEVIRTLELLWELAEADEINNHVEYL